jgi:hypothetical protein
VKRRVQFSPLQNDRVLGHSFMIKPAPHLTRAGNTARRGSVPCPAPMPIHRTATNEGRPPSRASLPWPGAHHDDPPFVLGARTVVSHHKNVWWSRSWCRPLAGGGTGGRDRERAWHSTYAMSFELSAATRAAPVKRRNHLESNRFVTSPAGPAFVAANLNAPKMT